MENRFVDAYRSALELRDFYLPHHQTFPMLEFYLLNPFQVLLYFHYWDEILRQAPFPKEMLLVNAYRHFSRAMAFAAFGQKENALLEKQQMLELAQHILATKAENDTKGKTFFSVATLLIDAKLAKLEQNFQESVDLLQQATAKNRPYLEWYFPLSQLLGAELFLAQKFPEAEKAFRSDLSRNPRNPRSLYGLFHSLKAQNRLTDAYWVEQEFFKAAQFSTTPFSMQDLAL